MPQSVQKPRHGRGAANARGSNETNDRAKRQLQSITSAETIVQPILFDVSRPDTVTSPALILDLHHLARLHLRAWRGLERFCDGLADRGIAFYDVDGFSAVFGSLDAACELTERLRASLVESEAA